MRGWRRGMIGYGIATALDEDTITYGKSLLSQTVVAMCERCHEGNKLVAWLIYIS